MNYTMENGNLEKAVKEFLESGKNTRELIEALERIVSGEENPKRRILLKGKLGVLDINGDDVYVEMLEESGDKYHYKKSLHGFELAGVTNLRKKQNFYYTLEELDSLGVSREIYELIHRRPPLTPQEREEIDGKIYEKFPEPI